MTQWTVGAESDDKHAMVGDADYSDMVNEVRYGRVASKGDLRYQNVFRFDLGSVNPGETFSAATVNTTVNFSYRTDPCVYTVKAVNDGDAPTPTTRHIESDCRAVSAQWQQNAMDGELSTSDDISAVLNDWLTIATGGKHVVLVCFPPDPCEFGVGAFHSYASPDKRPYIDGTLVSAGGGQRRVRLFPVMGKADVVNWVREE